MYVNYLQQLQNHPKDKKISIGGIIKVCKRHWFLQSRGQIVPYYSTLMSSILLSLRQPGSIRIRKI